MSKGTGPLAPPLREQGATMMGHSRALRNDAARLQQCVLELQEWFAELTHRCRAARAQTLHQAPGEASGLVLRRILEHARTKAAMTDPQHDYHQRAQELLERAQSDHQWARQERAEADAQYQQALVEYEQARMRRDKARQTYETLRRRGMLQNPWA